MKENEGGYPITIEELVKMWLSFGWQLHVASIGENGIPAINADEAMNAARDAVAIAASKLSLELFHKAYCDPQAAAEQIARRAEAVVSRAGSNLDAATGRTAEIIAKRFGLR